MRSALPGSAPSPDRPINVGNLIQVNATHHASGVCFGPSSDMVNNQMTTVNVSAYPTPPRHGAVGCGHAVREGQGSMESGLSLSLRDRLILLLMAFAMLIGLIA